MTDHAAADYLDDLAPRKSTGWRRFAFWGAAALTLVAAAVAAIAPQAAGPGGLVLLAGIAGSGLVLLYALAAGEAAARWLRPGADAMTDAEPGAPAAAFECLSDPALIADRGGSPRRANAAYRALAKEAGAMGESGRPPGFERVLGGQPGVSSAIYRLARASRKREALAESLPAASFGADGNVTAFDLEVTPLPTGETLWRARKRASGDKAQVGGDPLLEDAPVGFFSATPDGKVQYMNATLRSWLGFEAAKDGIAVKDFVSGDAGRVLGKDKRRVGGTARAEVMLKARDGIETSAVIVTTWPVEGDRRKASRSVVYGLTSTGAPVGVAQALAAPTTGEAGSMLDAMFANAPFGVARLDGPDVINAVIEDANPALLDITGGAAAPGRKFAALFELDADARSALEETGSGGGARAQLTLANDKDRHVDVYFAPDRGGRKAAYVVDVSEQKKLENLYMQAQKMQAIGQLAGGVAHDMNNMLTAIRGHADSLLESHPVGDPSYSGLQKINQMVSRGAGLVRQLLAFSRRETHRSEVLDLSSTLSDFSILLRQILEENVKLETVHGRDLPYVKADKGHLENAIINLATNARDAMRDNGGGTITIRSGRATHEDIKGVPDGELVEGDYAVIEVADTGVGMDDETVQKIFEPFFTTKDVGKGTGLGLATVFGIVRQSGGHVTVESKRGHGTTFKIFLPAYAPSQAELDGLKAASESLKEEPKPVSLNGRGRILLVEDESGVRKISAATLRKRGYDVVEAEDGEEAFELLQDEPGAFDLMISDVIMPGMDGPTLLRKAREQLGDAKIVFISGYAEEHFSETLSSEREVSFLPKPFSQPGLAEKVKSLIGEVED